MGASPQGLTFIRTAVALNVLATLAVALRFLARWRTKMRIGSDDYLIVVALFLAYSMLVETCLWATRGSIGKPAATLTRPQRETFAKIFYSNQISYTLLVPTIKVSILLFYRRIFTSRKFRYALFVAGGIVVAWCLAALFTAIFQCTPVSFYWNKTIRGGHCIDRQRSFWGNAISNLLTDVMILVLPLPVIWRLYMSIPQRIALSGIFLLGGFVCVASIMRIVSLGIISARDPTYSVVQPAIWTAVEPCVGIISACLPTLRPLFSAFSSALTTTFSKSGLSSRHRGTNALETESSKDALQANNSNHHMLDGVDVAEKGGAKVQEADRGQSSGSDEACPLGGIVVTKDIRVN